MDPGKDEGLVGHRVIRGAVGLDGPERNIRLEAQSGHDVAEIGTDEAAHLLRTEGGSTDRREGKCQVLDDERLGIHEGPVEIEEHDPEVHRLKVPRAK